MERGDAEPDRDRYLVDGRPAHHRNGRPAFPAGPNGRRGPGAPRAPSRAMTTSRGRANGPASSARPAPRSRGRPVPRTAPESRSGTFGRIRTGRIRSGPPLPRPPRHREPAPGTLVCREYPGQVATPAPEEAPGRPSHLGRQHPDIRPDDPSRREWPGQGVPVRLDLATRAVPVTSAGPATSTCPAVWASAATRAPPRICAGPAARKGSRICAGAAIWVGVARRRVAPVARAGLPTQHGRGPPPGASLSVSPISGQPVRERPVRGRPVRGPPVRGRPVRGGLGPGRAVRRRPVSGRSPTGPDGPADADSRPSRRARRIRPSGQIWTGW